MNLSKISLREEQQKGKDRGPMHSPALIHVLIGLLGPQGGTGRPLSHQKP